MRTIGFTLATLLVGATGCKWTDFDDLSDATWVKSTEKPTDNASDYGIAVARGLRTGSGGGTLVALGTGQALYSELVYDAKGNSSYSPNEVKLNTEFAISSLPDQPLLIADPESDDITLATASGQNSIAVLTGTGGLNVQQIFNQTTVDAATYIKFDAAQKTKPIIGAGTNVFGVDTENTSMAHQCALTDDATAPIQIAALGAARLDVADTSDKLIVWTKTGQLFVYDATVWSGTTAGCTGTAPLGPPVETGFTPGTGAQIFTLPGSTRVVLAGRQGGSGGAPNGPAARVVMYDLAGGTPTIVGAPLDKDGLHGMAIASFDGGTTQFFIAGYPQADAGGVQAGQVFLYPIDASGIDTLPAVTLNDAQPDSGQQFGRAVTTMPFNGRTALIVTANNEVYAYVRLSPLYDDLRQ